MCNWHDLSDWTASSYVNLAVFLAFQEAEKTFSPYPCSIILKNTVWYIKSEDNVKGFGSWVDGSILLASFISATRFKTGHLLWALPAWLHLQHIGFWIEFLKYLIFLMCSYSVSILPYSLDFVMSVKYWNGNDS